MRTSPEMKETLHVCRHRSHLGEHAWEMPQVHDLLMYYDLSFNADDLEPFAARERSAAATTLGYSVVATNTTALERLTAKDRCFHLH